MLASQASPLMKAIVCRLMTAGWVESYSYMPPTGYQLTWSITGAEKAFFLKDAVSDNGLDKDGAAVAFTRDCQTEEDTTPLGDFWMACLRELSLKENEMQPFTGFILECDEEAFEKCFA